jgi:hypothetical protein
VCVGDNLLSLSCLNHKSVCCDCRRPWHSRPRRPGGASFKKFSPLLDKTMEWRVRAAIHNIAVLSIAFKLSKERARDFERYGQCGSATNTKSFTPVVSSTQIEGPVTKWKEFSACFFCPQCFTQ